MVLVPFLSQTTKGTPSFAVPKGTEVAGIWVQVQVLPLFIPFCRPSRTEPYQTMLELLGSTANRSPRDRLLPLPSMRIVELICVQVVPWSAETKIPRRPVE